MSPRRKTEEEAGTAAVFFSGDALYLTEGGGTFTHEGVNGSFAPTMGGAAMIVYVEGGGAYECRAVDIIAAAIEHHLKRST